MNKKKLTLALPLLLAASIAGGSLSSCSLGDGVDPYSVDVNMEIPEGTTIQFWTGFGDDISGPLQELLAQFTDETGIVVEYESKSGYDSLKQNIGLSASSRSYPHLALAYPDHMADYVMRDIIVRLDYYVETDEGEDKITPDDFYEDYMVENYEVEFDEEGEPYLMGIPFNKSTEAMTYNKTFFEWAARLDPSIHVPATWDEVRSVGHAINDLLEKGTAASGNSTYFGKIAGPEGETYSTWEEVKAAGLAQGDVLDFRLVTAELFHPLGYDSGANFFITMVRQWGGEYTGIDEETREGYVAFDSDVVKEALAYFKTLHEEDVVAIPADFGETSYCSGPFTELQSVMNIGSTAGTAHSVPAAARFVTDVAPVPYKDAERMYVISQGTNLVLLDKGTEEERAAAWKLLKWLTKWHNGEFCAETGYFPSCEYSENSAAYQEFLTREPQNYADYVAQSTSLVNSEHYINPEKGWTKFVDTPFVGSSIVRDSVDAIMQMLFFGEGATPESVIQDRYQDIRAAGIETR